MGAGLPVSIDERTESRNCQSVRHARYYNVEED
jgi:hypothetical protein